MTQRPTRRPILLTGAAAWLAAALMPRLASAQNAISLRITGDRGRTRLLLALPPGQRYSLGLGTAPDRLILQLPGLAWPPGPMPAGRGLVEAPRFEPGRLIIPLAEPARPVLRLIEGRLRIGLLPSEPAAFLRLARAAAPLAEGSMPGLVAARQPPTPAASPAPDPAPAPAPAIIPAGRRPLVIIDPGHGGRDPGAIGALGSQEKHITLATALELTRILDEAGQVRVALTRTQDDFIPLAERVDLARRAEAALFLSLHADSAPGGRGASVYTLAETATDPLAEALARRENAADVAGGLRLPSVSPEVAQILLSLMRAETQAGSARLARQAVAALGEATTLLPHPHRQAAFVVLKSPETPSALVELGFLSNGRDEAALRRAEHRTRLAEALVIAIHNTLR